MRFQVRDRARSVRVRLAFVSLADRTTYRVNLGGRRTGRQHTYSWTRDVAAGAYRVRITARNPRGKKAVRSTTMQVARRARAGHGGRTPLPDRRSVLLGRQRTAASAPPATATRHQGQDLAAAEGTPLVAVADRHDLVARVPGRRRRPLPGARRRRRGLQLRLHAPPVRQPAGPQGRPRRPSGSTSRTSATPAAPRARTCTSRSGTAPGTTAATRSTRIRS